MVRANRRRREGAQGAHHDRAARRRWALVHVSRSRGCASSPGCRRSASPTASPTATDHVFGRSASVDLHGDKDAELLKWFPLSRTYQCGYDNGSGGRTPVRQGRRSPSLLQGPAVARGIAAVPRGLAGGLLRRRRLCRRRRHGHPRTRPTGRTSSSCATCARAWASARTASPRSPGAASTVADSDLHRVHLIGADLVEDFFLLSEHRRRFSEAQKAFHRRGWIVRSVEATDRVEEVFCAVVDDTHAFVLEDNILTGNCFGCQKSGDAITFIRELEHLDFVEAVERLAARAGITLRYDDAAVGKDRKRKQRLAGSGGRGDRLLPPAAARVGERGHRAALPAQPRLRRRRRAPVLVGMVAGRVRRGERASPEEEVLARRHRRRRPRVREQGEPAPRLVPRSA